MDSTIDLENFSRLLLHPLYLLPMRDESAKERFLIKGLLRPLARRVQGTYKRLVWVLLPYHR